MAVWAHGSESDAPNTRVEAITFAEEPGKVYLPLLEVVSVLDWPVPQEDGDGRMRLMGVTFMPRGLTDGTQLIDSQQLQEAGASLLVDEQHDGAMRIRTSGRSILIVIGPKHVEVSLTKQRLTAWQGDRRVLECRISSGRYPGSTPLGDFRTGPYKSRMHYSRLFDNAPMPWSVQINGHIFIHGFSSVPDHPASHGCIRLPLNEGNPAKFFYDWVDIGTPVRIIL